MPWWGWLIIGLYVLGFVLMWRTITWAIIADVTGGYSIDGGDVIGGFFFGTIGTLIWPFILFGLGVRAIYHAREEDALNALMPRRVRREKQLRDREARIARMERELGIGRG